jgi:hypothetical protein
MSGVKMCRKVQSCQILTNCPLVSEYRVSCFEICIAGRNAQKTKLHKFNFKLATCVVYVYLNVYLETLTSRVIVVTNT